MKDVSRLCVSPGTSFRDVLTAINVVARGVALVIDDDRRLMGVVTDGDARRAVLDGVQLSVTAGELLERKPRSNASVTARAGTSQHDLVSLVRRTGVSHVPLLNEASQVVDLVTLEDLLIPDELALRAVVMAGGQGSRLRPLTETTPKPMLPVGDRPLMEHTIRNLSRAGIREVHIATHHLGEQITEHFGDGGDFGVDVCYVPEKQLLGTVGAIGLIPTSDTPILVINGDILTAIDFRAMRSFHREHEAELTIAVRQHDIQVPYGVVETEGPRLTGLVEKPVQRYLVNAGIYLLEPVVRQFIPPGERFDMTDLIQVVMGAGHQVICFPVWEYWRDVGEPAGYQQAVDDVKSGRVVG